MLRRAAGAYDKVSAAATWRVFDPNAIVDWVRSNVAAVIRGNHDKAAVGLESLGGSIRWRGSPLFGLRN